MLGEIAGGGVGVGEIPVTNPVELTDTFELLLTLQTPPLVAFAS